MTEIELLNRAQNGDAEAFAQLCEAHRGRIWRTVSSVVRRKADAEDLAQETVIKAWQAMGSYRGEASLGSWLTRIALNTAHDHQKSAWMRRVQFWKDDRPDEPDGALPIPEQAERQEQQRRVRTAVARLGEKERTPIHLIYFEEYSIAEIARLEGVPESTIRSRVKVGLKRLSGALCEKEIDSCPPLQIGEGA
ncbi:RNA polymerase sigma factor [Armatimonas sp.]|uniref:RNA polymerase sigma factor n=1 Tax=Armatimonas sp. TaxID=1872638 RepID=UPI003752FAA7